MKKNLEAEFQRVSLEGGRVTGGGWRIGSSLLDRSERSQLSSLALVEWLVIKRQFNAIPIFLASFVGCQTDAS